MNDNNIKYHLYIIGAGATMAIYPKTSEDNESEKGAPQTSELLMGALTIKETDLNSLQPRIRRIYDESKKIVKRFLSDFNLPNPNIEDILTFLDLAINQKEPISYKNPVHKLEEVKRAITSILSILLMIRLVGNGNNLRQQFIKHLRDENDSFYHQDRRIAIIDLNYDLVLEKPLESYCNYGFEHYKFINLINQDRSLKKLQLNDEDLIEANNVNDRNEILLLKPHGSLSWFVCQSCKTVYRNSLDKVAGYLGVLDYSKYNPSCPKCESILTGSLVTPSFLKDVKLFPYDIIWKNMEKVINNSIEITIIGYTLPEADKEFRYILRKNIYKNFDKNINNGNNKCILQKLSIITGSPLKDPYSELEKKKIDDIKKSWIRFHEYFGSLLEFKKENFWPFGFEEYFNYYMARNSDSKRTILEERFNSLPALIFSPNNTTNL